MADYTVLRADFRETLAAAKGQAALIATSPPYPDARTCYESLDWEDYQALGDAVKGALLPGGHCLLNLSAPVRQLREGHGTERDPMPFRVMLDWADRVGLTCPDALVFGRSGLPGKFPRRFRGDYEPLFWFRKPGPELPVFPERIKLKAVGSFNNRRSGARNRDGSIDRQEGGAACKRPAEVYRGNLWAYGNVGGSAPSGLDHPARMYHELAADIVACFSDVGDLVVDPFLGGGTTLCAACDGERRFLGGDLSEEWVGAEIARACGSAILPALDRARAMSCPCGSTVPRQWLGEPADAAGAAESDPRWWCPGRPGAEGWIRCPVPALAAGGMDFDRIAEAFVEPETGRPAGN